MALEVDRVSVAGSWWRRDGCRGILYASAARPEHRGLCLFRDNIAIPGAEPVRPPETHRDPPTPPRGMHT